MCNVADRPEPTQPTKGNSIQRVWLGGHDVDARRCIERRLIGTNRPPTGPLDAAFITPRTIEEAVHFAEKLRDRLEPDGTLMVALFDPHKEPDRAPISIGELRLAIEAAGYAHVETTGVNELLQSVQFKLGALYAEQTENM